MTPEKEKCTHENVWATPNGVIGCWAGNCLKTWTVEEYTEEIRQQTRKETAREIFTDFEILIDNVNKKYDVAGGSTSYYREFLKLKKKFGVE